MKTSRFLLVAGILLAMAFTFSCSDNSSPEPTYYCSEYGIKDCSGFEAIASEMNALASHSFEDVESAWSRIRQLDGDFIESRTGISESSIRDYLIKHDKTPKEADANINSLKARGNFILYTYTNNNRYCMIVDYLELE
jgi:hypothetical protein